MWTFVSYVGGNTTQPDNNNSNNNSSNNNGQKETLDQKVGTNIQGIKLPANYYDRKVVGYFPNYAINSEAHEKFSIADLQWDVLTHVQYAFGVVNPQTCKLEAGDIQNDIENRFQDRKFYHDGVEIKIPALTLHKGHIGYPTLIV